jgi:hypothetical protein
MKMLSLQKAIVIGAAITALPCLAADTLPSYNLHPTFPTDLADAYPIGYQTLSAFGIVRYQRTEDGRNDWLLQPEVRYGFAPEWEADIAIPFREGNYKGTGGGNIRLGALYNFLLEEDWRPSLAVGPQAELPTGRASRGVDIGLTLAASKSLEDFIPDARGDAVHFNFSWNYNMQSRDIERDNIFRFALGYSREIYENLIGVADFVHQQTILKGHDENILEAGVVYRWFEQLSVAGGLGFGLGAESPDVRVTTGVQYTF